MAHGWELNEVSDTRNGGLYILGILHMHELIPVLRSGKDTKSRASCYTIHIVRSNRKIVNRVLDAREFNLG
jgi:hypothetical protein